MGRRKASLWRATPSPPPESDEPEIQSRSRNGMPSASAQFEAPGGGGGVSLLETPTISARCSSGRVSTRLSEVSVVTTATSVASSHRSVASSHRRGGARPLRKDKNKQSLFTPREGENRDR